MENLNPSNSSKSPLTTAQTPTILPINSRRKNSFWEIIYDPKAKPPVGYYDWNTESNCGPKDLVCQPEQLNEIMEKFHRKNWVMPNVKFKKCDFVGTFEIEQIVFNDCEFENCDFGRSNWSNAKFSQCKFTNCSLTQTSFDKCYFIDCEWKHISISGVETKLSNTTISNPFEFINSAYTNLNEKDYPPNKNITKVYQKMRLEKTKAKIARLILRNNEQNGDDHSYYESIKTYLIQTAVAKKEVHLQSLNEKWYGKIIFSRSTISMLHNFEMLILKSSGAINNWGASIVKPFIAGFLVFIFFSIWYYFLFLPEPSIKIKNFAIYSAIKSLDITLLVGYTKHASIKDDTFSQISYGINAILGLWWYAILVPTVINRISRVR